MASDAATDGIDLSEIRVDRFESGVERDIFTLDVEDEELAFERHKEFFPSDNADPLWKIQHPEFGEMEIECPKDEAAERIIRMIKVREHERADHRDWFEHVCPECEQRWVPDDEGYPAECPDCDAYLEYEEPEDGGPITE